MRYRYSAGKSRLVGRLRREHETFRSMAHIYCGHYHGPTGTGLCAECESLMQYAEKRLEKCPYGQDKPTCANCPVHCYKPAQREQARVIMRFAGPRMPWRHPLRSIAHIFDKLRKVQHPLQLRRAKQVEKPASLSGTVQGAQASDRNQARPAPSKPKAGS